MKEMLLHFIWQYRLFSAFGLKTTDGEDVEVINAGLKNNNAGPDFFNAKIKIAGTVWAGNVEIHIRASDWDRHQHTSDQSYDSVVLHVVADADRDIYRSNGEKIPCVKLDFPDETARRYDALLSNSLRIPCADRIGKVPEIVINGWKNNLLIERLQYKTEHLRELLTLTGMHWEEVFYISLARSMGFSVNAQVFEMLAKSIPLSVVAKHKQNLFELEALFFGQAGLLSETASDEYVLKLSEEYRFLKAKYKIKPLEGTLWKFLRLRPDNFPTVRIAQFCSVVHNSSKLFSKITEKPEPEYVGQMFHILPSDYWLTHYRFGEKVGEKPKRIGKESVNSLLINTVVPLLFLYGEKSGKETLKQKAVEILESLPTEKNALVIEWKSLGIKIETAYDSQAFIHLKKNYCEQKKCIQCRIGHKVLTI